MSRDVNFDIKAKDKTGPAFNSVKKKIAGMALGVGAAVGSFYAAAKGVEAVVAAANVQREAEEKLNSVLEATGHAAGFSLQQLQNMAASMQEVTTFGDEVTMSGMAILATFKNIQGQAFERTTRAAMDMSTVLGQDLNSSMMQLGKALNDPVAGLTALQRIGVTFTEDQKEQIKTLMEAGDLYGAQSIILAELESQFGGAAEAAAGTFGGALDQLKNTFGDLLEEIGFAITENEVFVELINRAKEFIANLIPHVGELVQQFADWIGPVEDLDEKIAVFKETLQMMLWPLKQAASLMNTVGTWMGETAGRLIYGDLPEHMLAAPGGGGGGGFASSFQSGLSPSSGFGSKLNRSTFGASNTDFFSRPSQKQQLRSAGIDASMSMAASGGGSRFDSFQSGTGPEGLPRDGLFYGHKGEIVLNPEESRAARSKNGGATFHITIAPTFMTGDQSAARAVAAELRTALNNLSNRWGG